MDMTTLSPGFADPILESQSVFRSLLEALSRPARPVPAPVAVEAPAPLLSSTGSAILALADLDTPVWLDPVLDQDAVVSWLRFHCGCPLTTDPAEATFALVGDASAPPALESFGIGSLDLPDRSTTVLIQVGALAVGAGPRFHGPGINPEAEAPIRLTPEGLAPDFWDQWAENGLLFPQGVDVLFTAPGLLCGLPRTTKVEV